MTRSFKELDGPRVCRTCGVQKQPRHFPRKSYTRGWVCIVCGETERRARGVQPRHVKMTIAGVWCNHHHRRHPADHFGRRTCHGIPGRFATYCFVAEHELGKMKMAIKRTDPATYQAENRRKHLHRQMQRRADVRARQDYIAKSIETLFQRGFTRNEIALMIGHSRDAIYGWERKQRRPHPAVEHHIARAIRATANLDPVPRRYRVSKPHPALSKVMEVLARS